MAYRNEEEIEKDRKTMLKSLRTWRDINTLIKLTKSSRSTVDRRLTELYAEGHIIYRQKPNQSGRGRLLEWRRA